MPCSFPDWLHDVGLETIFAPPSSWNGQATITPKVKGVEYDSALAMAVANLEDMDWDRVRRQLAEIGHEEPWLGPVMAKLHPRVIRDAKRLALG